MRGVSKEVALLAAVVLVTSAVAAPVTWHMIGATDEDGGHAAAQDDGSAGPADDFIDADCVNDDASGQNGSGGPAVAHHAGGVPADPGSVPVPDARLYRTCVIAAEPTLGLTSDGDIFFTAVEWTDTPFGPFAPIVPFVMRSQDGGVTWESVYSRNADTLDPYTYVDKRTDRIFTVDYDGCHFVSFSSDGGEEWTMNPTAGCGWNQDHQTLFSGPPALDRPADVTPHSDYPTVTYMCSIGTGLAASTGTTSTCSKSLDGGLTWTPTGAPAYTFVPGAADAVPGADGCYAGNSHGFVGWDGTVYLPRGHCGQPTVAISEDEGTTWERVRVADNGMPQDGGIVDHESAVVADSEGNVYFFWVARDRRPYLATSTDGGRTWSDPIDVGPPGLDESMLPAMAIGADGKLALAYMGSTNSPFPEEGEDARYDDNVAWHGYMSVTPDALADDPLFLTTTINDPDEPLTRGACGPFRCQQQFDFIDVQVGPDGQAWSSFVDGCEDGECEFLGEGVVGTLAGGPDLYAGGPNPYETG